MGADLLSIAAQKAGIIKKGTVCLAYSENENVRRIIKEEAQKAGGEVVFIEPEFKIEGYDWTSNLMLLKSVKDNKKIKYTSWRESSYKCVHCKSWVKDIGFEIFYKYK